ncbi:MAG TPA: FHA domain-containing protein [Bacillota bacterium]|nr:FHA domain-containing protein [Bacillota bacterium]
MEERKRIVSIDRGDLTGEPRRPIVITHADLAAPAPSVEQAPVRKSVRSFFLHRYLGNALFGVVGGLLAAIATELALGGDDPEFLFSLLVDTGLFAGAAAAFIGAVLSAGEDLVGGGYRRAARGALRAVAVGLPIGFLGGVLAQIVYSALGGGTRPDFGLQVAVRGAGWALAGGAIGLAQGVARGRWLHGAVGGLLGGLAGGLGFDVIGMAFAAGTASRFIGLGCIGLAVGVGIAAVHELLKQAWLTIESGKLAGKQYVLYLPHTTVGSARTADLSLVGDLQVRPVHCVLRRAPQGWTIERGDGTLVVNGRQMVSALLRTGDVVQLGGTRLRYLHRAVRSGG